MAMTLHVDIVSTSKEIFSGPATLVTALGELGELGILPRHSQLLTRLQPGPVRLKTLSGEELVFYVSGGLMELPDGCDRTGCKRRHRRGSLQGL